MAVNKETVNALGQMLSHYLAGSGMITLPNSLKSGDIGNSAASIGQTSLGIAGMFFGRLNPYVGAFGSFGGLANDIANMWGDYKNTSNDERWRIAA